MLLLSQPTASECPLVVYSTGWNEDKECLWVGVSLKEFLKMFCTVWGSAVIKFLDIEANNSVI